MSNESRSEKRNVRVLRSASQSRVLGGGWRVLKTGRHGPAKDEQKDEKKTINEREREREKERILTNN